MDQQKGTGIEELVHKAGYRERDFLVWHIGHVLGRDAYVGRQKVTDGWVEYLRTSHSL
jgi:hypothetical protein